MAVTPGFANGVRHAARYPKRARWYLHRVRRDIVLKVKHRGDHLAYYGAVVDDLVLNNHATAVGNVHRPAWQRIGQMQFDYLTKHGLKPNHRLLEIGCGNLRAGRHFIHYLDPGHYYGIDISQEVIFAAQRMVIDQLLTEKVPYLTLNRDMLFELFPDEYFDAINAHSVFSHCPLPVLEECFGHIARIMKPDAIFDFTFKRSDDKEYGRLGEDYYFKAETLVDAAERHGLKAKLMDDWEELGHSQSKIRVTR